MLEDAIFTAPPHPFHSGAALVGDDGRLLGIGSLFVANAIAENAQMPGNMFVPVDELKPILADLLERGRRSGAVRPWLGLTTNERFGRVIFARVTEDGPAARAGMKQGDIILGVGGAAIAGQADFYKKIWGIGSAGAPVPLAVLPAGAMVFEATTYNVKSIDRYDWLKIDKGL
jgi:S1-C subfamily serine protease